MSREKYCKSCDLYYVGPECPQYHPAPTAGGLAAIEAALKVADRKTDIFDAAWASLRHLQAAPPPVGEAGEGTGLAAIASDLYDYIGRMGYPDGELQGIYNRLKDALGEKEK